jgi:hypothetical protein
MTQEQLIVLRTRYPKATNVLIKLLHDNPEGLNSLHEVSEVRVHWEDHDPHVKCGRGGDRSCRNLVLDVHTKRLESTPILVPSNPIKLTLPEAEIKIVTF